MTPASSPESWHREKQPSARAVLLTMAVGFGILTLVFNRFVPVAMVLGAISMTAGFFGLLMPNRAGWLVRGWMRLAHLIGSVTNPLVLGIIYVGMVVPMGLVRQVSGNHTVRRKMDGVESYWITRKPGPAPESLKQQF